MYWPRPESYEDDLKRILEGCTNGFTQFQVTHRLLTLYLERLPFVFAYVWHRAVAGKHLPILQRVTSCVRVYAVAEPSGPSPRSSESSNAPVLSPIISCSAHQSDQTQRRRQQRLSTPHYELRLQRRDQRVRRYRDLHVI